MVGLCLARLSKVIKVEQYGNRVKWIVTVRWNMWKMAKQGGARLGKARKGGARWCKAE